MRAKNAFTRESASELSASIAALRSARRCFRLAAVTIAGLRSSLAGAVCGSAGRVGLRLPALVTMAGTASATAFRFCGGRFGRWTVVTIRLGMVCRRLGRRAAEGKSSLHIDRILVGCRTRACHQLSQTTLATTRTAARKLRAVFSYRVAIARNCLILAKKFSIRWRGHIKLSLIVARRGPMGSWRDHRSLARLRQRLKHARVGVERLVADQRIGLHPGQQVVGPDQVVRLPASPPVRIGQLPRAVPESPSYCLRSRESGTLGLAAPARSGAKPTAPRRSQTGTAASHAGAARHSPSAVGEIHASPCYSASMNVALRKPWTQQQFFSWAEAQEARYEFDGVQPIAMTGGTNGASAIGVNLITALRTRLRGRCVPATRS